jgi:hypothetical protein
MRKEDIESVARILTEIKDSLGELESALKVNNKIKTAVSKTKIITLQNKIKGLL